MGCLRKLIWNTQHKFDICLTMVCQYPALVWRSFAYELRTFAYELRSFTYMRRWRLHCTFTAHLLGNVCSAIARRFFLTCSKFDGARSACLVHLHCVRLAKQRVNEDPRAYVAYLPRISYFFSYAVSAQYRRPV